MNKQALIQKIIAHLREERELLLRAARASREEATHEQSRADNKYDTRGLEAAYLARGQSRQVAEVELALQQFEALLVRPFGPADPIDLGALVELKSAKARQLYFVGPRSGGIEITHEKKEILVITPPSPLGQQLMTKRKGDRVQLQIAGQREQFEIISVS